MERLKSDTEGGFCALPENNGAELDGHCETFQLAPVLTIFCPFAAPEVAAFLRDNPPGTEDGPDLLDHVITTLNPGASLSLSDCWGMEDCHIKVPHPDPLEGPVAKISAVRETQESESEDSSTKSDDNVEIHKEKGEVDEKGHDMVEIVREVNSEESTNDNGEGVKMKMLTLLL